MKAKARLITGSLRAKARAIGGITAEAWAVASGVQAKAEPTDGVNLLKYLRVTPEHTQELVWLVPQVGIDYTVESNTNWNII